MILSQNQTIETHPDGSVSYMETKAVIAPMWQQLYPNRRTADDGTMWIRTGVNRKYKPDGSIEWEINYDENGNVIN